MKKYLIFLAGIMFIARLANASGDQTMEKENIREALIAEELAKYEHRVFKYDAQSLSEKEKAFLSHMLAAAKIVEEINMLQIHPKNLDFQLQVEKDGRDKDKELFHRNQCPWCLDSNDPLCNALHILPEKQIGWGFWPEGMNEMMLKELEKQKDAQALLSPYTVVQNDAKGRFKAIPFAKWPLIEDRLGRLSSVLRDAETFADDPTLKKFLRSRAKAFESNDPFPYDKSDFDWIALEGPWELTVGPYETYKEPMKEKAQFEMYIGREDRDMGPLLNDFKDHLQEFENHFANFIGRDLYRARRLDLRIKIRAVELIYAAGDARSPHGATVAYHLPNRGKAVGEGLYKKVLLINHMRLFTPLMQKRARLALVRDQAELVDGWADIMNTAFHEFAHGFGAHEELPIILDGKKTTVGKALGPMETLMEELKADVASLWFIPYLKTRGLLKDEDIPKRYTTAVMHLFGLLQYSLSGTYPQMAAIEVGKLMENGALTFDSKSGRFTIHFDKIADVVESLMKQIVTIQLTGDKAAAESLREQYVKRHGEEKFEFAKLLSNPLAKIKDVFDRAKLRSFAIDYEVTGL